MKKQYPFDPLNEPYLPSRTRIGAEIVVTNGTAISPNLDAPIHDNVGWPVSAWNAVLLAVSYLGALAAADMTATLRIWRWRETANLMAGTPAKGAWFADEEFTVALDGNVGLNGPMDRVLMTNCAEKIYVQVIDFPKLGVANPQLVLNLFGVGARRGEGGEMVVVASGGGANACCNSTPVPSALSKDVLFSGDQIYSNLREDFTAVIATTTTITLGALPARITPENMRIVAIGTRPAAGSVGWTFIYDRSTDQLDVSYAALTITFATAILTVGYDVAVWLEDIPRYQGSNIDATYHLQTRDEAFTVATRSERTEEIDPIDTKYVPDTVADVTNGTDATYDYFLDMSTFRKLGLQLELSGGSGVVTVTIWGTVQDDGTAAATCLYQDVGLATFVTAGSWTADAMLIDNAEKLGCYKYIRIRVIAASTNDDGDWTIYAKRLY